MLKSKKKLKIFIFTISFVVFFLFFFGENIKNSFKTSLNDNNVIKYKFFKDLIKVIGDPRYIMNDYNVNFLPKTQFIDFESFKFKINDEAQYSHYIEVIDKNLLVISDNLKVNIIGIENINLKKKKIQLKKIDNNLKDLFIKDILDTKFYNNEIIISFKKTSNNNCNSVAVAHAVFDLKILKFKELFSIDECANGALWGGAIDIYNTENGPGILLSTSDVIRSDDEDVSKEKDKRAQEDRSFYHKILYFNFKKRELEIFSKGHRNPGSIFVDNDVILSTEHGPRGGDEINLIKKNGNYGWPISSYGDLYFSKQDKPYYKKNHKEYGFVEPIYSYVPSIGISAIIKVPNYFDEYWKNNFLIASLYGNSLYRVKFDDKFNKILFSEKIYIGERIRDIKFYEDLIILTFEGGLDLGILKKIKY